MCVLGLGVQGFRVKGSRFCRQYSRLGFHVGSSAAPQRNPSSTEPSVQKHACFSLGLQNPAFQLFGLLKGSLTPKTPFVIPG